MLPVVGIALVLLRIQFCIRLHFRGGCGFRWSGWALAGISKFMWFLVIFTGYWIVFWQQYISLPVYITST